MINAQWSIVNDKCIVTDRFDIIQDPKIPFLQDALDPIKVKAIFQSNFCFSCNKFQLLKIEVIRYKPQKRCLIEYHFQGEQPLVLIGKIRAKGLDLKSYKLQKQLWHSGFNNHSDDEISVT